MSAGSSKADVEFAAQHADVCFVSGDEIAKIRDVTTSLRERAAAHGREISVWTNADVICGQTEAEVQRLYDYNVREKGDFEAAKNQMHMMIGGGSQSSEHGFDQALLERFVAMQHAHPLFGTPAQIVEKMEALADAGIDGLNLVWMDYEQGIAQFRDEVIPLAQEAGLRA